jgi:hypothetical protein
MTREEEYKLTLLHVIKWLMGEDYFDQLKPVSAETANRIARICDKVVSGKTLKEAIEETAP